MALVSLDPARCLAWSESGHGMVIFSSAWTPATLKKGSVRSAPTDRPWPRARHRPGCFARLHSRCRGPVSMAPGRRCRDPIGYRDLETLACATPQLGRYAGQFLGSHHLVMAHGERPWSRAHGRAGTSRREVGLLRSSSIQRKLTALLSPPDRRHCGGRSYDLSFSHRRIDCLDRLRFYWGGGVASLMDQSRSDLVF